MAIPHLFSRNKDNAKFCLRQLTLGMNMVNMICLFFNDNTSNWKSAKEVLQN